MDLAIFALLGMIFLHIYDDFNLQSRCLVDLKQKQWWMKNASDNLYKYDYLAGLFMHSFSWSFCVMLIPYVYCLYYGYTIQIGLFLYAFITHFIIDHFKCNMYKINLIHDQFLHITVIITIWAIVFLVRL